MDEKGFFILFAILLIAVFVTGINGGGIGNNASSTAASSTKISTLGTVGKATTFSQGVSGSYSSNPSNNRKQNLSNQEIQAELEDLYDEFWELQQKVDSYERKQPVSRYAGKVQLVRSSSGNTNPEREYLTLTVNQGVGPINISDWYLESYVTEKRMSIPNGIKVYRDGGAVNITTPIILEPGQRAYLITGESPVNVSFQENSCIGYLSSEEQFYPHISNKCPAPRELLTRYSGVALDDDSCYEFIERQWGCNTVDDTNAEFNELSGTCRKFIEKYLNYNSCVDAFSWRTDFDKDNDWYIYFERDEEIWRQKREIIRLMDQYDAVVATIEYY